MTIPLANMKKSTFHFMFCTYGFISFSRSENTTQLNFDIGSIIKIFKKWWDQSRCFAGARLSLIFQSCLVIVPENRSYKSSCRMFLNQFEEFGCARVKNNGFRRPLPFPLILQITKTLVFDLSGSEHLNMSVKCRHECLYSAYGINFLLNCRETWTPQTLVYPKSAFVGALCTSPKGRSW